MYHVPGLPLSFFYPLNFRERIVRLIPVIYKNKSVHLIGQVGKGKKAKYMNIESHYVHDRQDKKKYLQMIKEGGGELFKELNE